MSDDILQKVKDDLIPKSLKDGPGACDTPFMPNFNHFAARIIFTTTRFSDEAKQAMWGLYWGLRP